MWIAYQMTAVELGEVMQIIRDETLLWFLASFILCGMGVAAYAIISVTLETIVK